MNYKVYQGTELKQTVTSKTAVMNGLQPNQTYDFSVEPDNTQTVGGRTRYTHVAYANMTYVATENGSFTLSESATVRFGYRTQWVYKAFDAGTYTASNDTFGRDPYEGMGKSAEVVSDFSVGQGSNNTYIGWYSDFTEADSNDPSQYTWNLNAKTSVTTRGIRFNIPKTLTVGSTITLRYEEYPLGIVPIGNEPSGYFGGGNKQNLSAKVISTANGSSVVEVAGNVIEVGGRNLLDNSSFELEGYQRDTVNTGTASQSNDVAYSGTYSLKVTATNSGDHGTSFHVPNPLPNTSYTFSGYLYSYSDKVVQLSGYSSGWASLGRQNVSLKAKTWTSFTYKLTTTTGLDNVRLGFFMNADTTAFYIDQVKIEPGTIATPYAAFVDGDTFTTQPDGTFALFSEYKALYY